MSIHRLLTSELAQFSCTHAQNSALLVRYEQWVCTHWDFTFSLAPFSGLHTHTQWLGIQVISNIWATDRKLFLKNYLYSVYLYIYIAFIVYIFIYILPLDFVFVLGMQYSSIEHNSNKKEKKKQALKVTRSMLCKDFQDFWKTFGAIIYIKYKELFDLTWSLLERWVTDLEAKCTSPCVLSGAPRAVTHTHKQSPWQPTVTLTIVTQQPWLSTVWHDRHRAHHCFPPSADHGGWHSCMDRQDTGAYPASCPLSDQSGIEAKV